MLSEGLTVSIKPYLETLLCHILHRPPAGHCLPPPLHSGKKKAHKHKLFVRLVLGRPRVCPGDLTGFVPGTNPVKTWDKPGFAPYSTQWKPDFTGFVPGTNPVCPWDNPGDEGQHRKFMRKTFMCLFRSLYTHTKWLPNRTLLFSNSVRKFPLWDYRTDLFLELIRLVK